MSIHPSLRSAGKAAASARNVLKRYERVRYLMTQGTWDEQRSVFGLPKIKQMKINARKAASKEKEAAAATTDKPAATPSGPSA